MERSAGCEDKWHYSIWPMLLSIGILFTLPLSFMFYFVYKNPMLSAISLGIGAPLVIISIIGWIKDGFEDYYGYSRGDIESAMPLFIISESLLFFGLFAAYWVVRLSAPLWPPSGTSAKPVLVPIIMTIVLLSSSFTINLSNAGIDQGSRRRFLGWLFTTIMLGIIFLAMSAYEWSELSHKGFVFNSNVYSSVFYSTTGFHAVHVFIGLAMFFAILIPALSGKLSRPFALAAAVYWHFVDIVWLFVVTQVYFW